MKRTLAAVLLIAGILGFVAWNNWGADKSAPDRISYNFHVRPILSDKCFACHGPDQNKLEAGLRLDLAEKRLRAIAGKPRRFCHRARQTGSIGTDEKNHLERPGLFDADPRFAPQPVDGTRN